MDLDGALAAKVSAVNVRRKNSRALLVCGFCERASVGFVLTGRGRLQYTVQDPRAIEGGAAMIWRCYQGFLLATWQFASSLTCA